jgi:hypothetical protein
MPSCSARSRSIACRTIRSGIVNDVFDFDACGGQSRGDSVAGVGLFEIARNHDRRSTARGGDLARQCRQAIPAPRHQSYAMAL